MLWGGLEKRERDFVDESRCIGNQRLRKGTKEDGMRQRPLLIASKKSALVFVFDNFSSNSSMASTSLS